MCFVKWSNCIRKGLEITTLCNVYKCIISALVKSTVWGCSFGACQFPTLVSSISCLATYYPGCLLLSVNTKLLYAQCYTLGSSTAAMCHWHFLFWQVSYLVVNGCDGIPFLQEMNHFSLATWSSLWWCIWQKDCQWKLSFSSIKNLSFLLFVHLLLSGK